MAGKDVDEIVVGANGTIRRAAVGTAAPADESAAPGVGWIDLGYASDDGVTFTNGKTTDAIGVWQLFHAARRIVTGVETTVAFVLRQWSKDTTELALDVAVTEPAPGKYKLTPTDPEVLTEHAVMVDWVDGDKHYRLVVPRCTVSDNVETNLTRSSAADLPVTLEVLGSDGVDPWYLLTDDPAFEAA